MRFPRALSWLLTGLLLWPVLSSAIVLSAAAPRAVPRRMACCVTSCNRCDRCAAGAESDACERAGESGSPDRCELGAAPCHSPVTRAGGVFAWEPFLPSPCVGVVRPPLAHPLPAGDPAAPRSRAAATPERPPAA